MADVYGFNEAKSKIAVVDKATQDAKDASQDTSINGLNERITALEEAGSGIDVVSVNPYNIITLTATFPAGSSSVSSAYSRQLYSTKEFDGSTYLLYDPSNMKFIQVDRKYNHTKSTNRGSGRGVSVSSKFETAIQTASEALIGQKVIKDNDYFVCGSSVTEAMLTILCNATIPVTASGGKSGNCNIVYNSCGANITCSVSDGVITAITDEYSQSSMYIDVTDITTLTSEAVSWGETEIELYAMVISTGVTTDVSDNYGELSQF